METKCQTWVPIMRNEKANFKVDSLYWRKQQLVHHHTVTTVLCASPCEVSNIWRVLEQTALIIFSLIFAFVFTFPPLAYSFAVEAHGQKGHTPAKLLEVDLLILVFIQYFHGLLDVFRIYLGLKITQLDLIRHDHTEQVTFSWDAEFDRFYL